MNPFVLKLRQGAKLTQGDEEILASLAQTVRRFDARGDIVLEGDVPRGLTLVLEGWCCLYKQLENGRRQIMLLLLPGDLNEPFGVLPQFASSSIGALTPVVLAHVSLDAIRDAARASPRIEQALWWDLLLASAMEREHVVSLGRRSASERLGHFFCELHHRLAMIGRVDGDACEFAVTQADLGDLLGLSSVHVNRSLQDLRRTGLVTLHSRRLVIHDLAELQAFSLFDPAYLHGRVWHRTGPGPASAR